MRSGDFVHGQALQRIVPVFKLNNSVDSPEKEMLIRVGAQTTTLAHVLEIFKTRNSKIYSLLCFKMLSPPWI